MSLGKNYEDANHYATLCHSMRIKKTVYVLLKKPLAAEAGVSTLEFQIDHTVGKNLYGWKNDIDNGARAREMCPDIKAIGIWLSTIENL